ncbi:CPCC family cysteine-rich protein [Streptomyces niveus]|uniref:CPCC family cysteine-rich protein n=2 Tax=Streptomyces niveus TaxID=193462 RepID=UPI003642FB96
MSSDSPAHGSAGWASRIKPLAIDGVTGQDAVMNTPFLNIQGKAEDGPHPCPCCGFLTLGERSSFEICPVCFWEDDGQDDHDADRVRGGPNGRLSLTEARRNFHAMGACDERCTQFVRAPLPNEHPTV